MTTYYLSFDELENRIVPVISVLDFLPATFVPDTSASVAAPASVTITDGVIIIQGELQKTNDVEISNEHDQITIDLNEVKSSFPTEDVQGIWYYGGFRRDTFSASKTVSQTIVVHSGAGADHITTGSGDDFIYAGTGNDRIDSGSGNDAIVAGAGVDWIYAREGDDTIFAQSGDDWVFAGAGKDVVKGGSGGDHVKGGVGNDLLIGGPGRDYLYGEEGIDVLIAGEGPFNYLNGGPDPDILFVGSGRNIIVSSNDDVVVEGFPFFDNIDPIPHDPFNDIAKPETPLPENDDFEDEIDPIIDFPDDDFEDEIDPIIDFPYYSDGWLDSYLDIFEPGFGFGFGDGVGAQEFLVTVWRSA